MTRQERYRQYLEMCAALPEPPGLNGVAALIYSPIYHQYAKVACGQKADDEAVLQGLEHMRVRLDCGDFRINMLLRMLYLYPDTPSLQQHTKAEIKDLLLDYDYWYGENAKFPGRQIIWTENHVMLFMTCEYLAAKLYPETVFRFRGKTGREIAQNVYPKLIRWIDMKLRIGFCEWNSNCYTEENMVSLLNLYDLSNDDVLKKKCRMLLDVMTLSLALNSYRGNYCTTHGRTYTRMLIKRQGATTALLEKLLWGREEIVPDDELFGLGSLALATSTYEPRPLIVRIALDETLEFENREQQSFDVEDAPLFGGGFDTFEDMTLFWHNMAYTHVCVVEKMFEMCEKFGIMVNPAVYPEYRYVRACRERGEEPEKCRVANYMSRVNMVTRRTPDYFLSCAQDFRKGELGFQQHIWQATMSGDAIVFTNHPGTLGEEDGRPDFWAGNYFHPRAFQYRDTVICMYNIKKECPLPYSHAYLPRREFDEVYTVRNWVFARKESGYMALHSQNGFSWTTEGRWADSELVCPHRENTWICQMGRKTEYGDFEIFISEILRCDISFDGAGLCYHTPHGQWLRCGWDVPLTVDETIQEVRDYPRFDSPICQSEYGSGKYRICYGGEALVLSM